MLLVAFYNMLDYVSLVLLLVSLANEKRRTPMGWFNGTRQAADAGRQDAESDNRAGGVGRGHITRRGEMSRDETKAYDKAYMDTVNDD